MHFCQSEVVEIWAFLCATVPLQARASSQSYCNYLKPFRQPT